MNGVGASVRPWGMVLVLGLAAAAGCSRGDGPSEPQAARLATTHAALNATPSIEHFAVYAENSIELRVRASVSGADIGVKVAGPGPFLAPGYELEVGAHARVDPRFNVLADSVRLKNKCEVGDVHASEVA